MKYKAELIFFEKILKNMDLKFFIFNEETPIDFDIDLGLRKALGLKRSYRELLHIILGKSEPNTIYMVTDDFSCKYVLLQLPDVPHRTFFLIGPYTEMDDSKQMLHEIIKQRQIPPDLTSVFFQYYSGITFVANPALLTSMLCTFGETIWGNADNYHLENITQTFTEPLSPLLPEPHLCEADTSFRIQLLEDRYDTENDFIQNVARGYTHKAESTFANSTLFHIEPRIPDVLRNFKNYCIVLNTLLRKAAELGAVHPIHIDQISRDFLLKIESIHSPAAGKTLMQEMIRKYCLLVKEHSMKGYSFLVRKVITRIDLDLTADLSLSAHAKLLNVNPSYLSALFKKETGQTLTEYVNQRRVQHGLLLLNNTDMQIQTVAQHCGVSDINYFTRIFKKQVGVTPSEYKRGT